MTGLPRRSAFSLVELLVALGAVAALVLVGISAGRQALAGARSSDSVVRLRTLGLAVLTHAGEHNQRLPGPLWPGQIMLYDAAREGRLVNELAGYLGVSHRDTPYVVARMIPKAYQANPTPGSLANLRVYVMNTSVVLAGQTNQPFGSLTASPGVDPMRLVELENLPASERWMISETDQLHPAVRDAPWKDHTPTRPVHGAFRAAVDFDGSARLEKIP